MSKCQAKVEKTVPRPIWVVTKKMENCPNDAKGEGFFCEVHGCFGCSRKSMEFCSEYEGVKLCMSCRGKREFEKKAEEERKNEIIEKGRKAFRKKKEAEEKERLRKELSAERASYVKKLENLEGLELLNISEKSDFLQQIKSSSISSLGSVLSSAQKLISLHRERERV